MNDLTRLAGFASRWFDRATVTGVFEPMLADWQREWLDAPPSHRRMIVIRGYAAFVATVIASLPRVGLAPIPGSLARRIAVRVSLFCLLAMVLEAIPFIWNPIRVRDATLLVPLSSWPYLLPSLLTLALPFAMISGVDAIRCFEDLPDHLQRRAGLKLVFAATLWMVIAGGWLVPAANQQWRVEVASANASRPLIPLRGARELTTRELFVTADAAFPLIRPGERQREINIRLSLAVLPLLLAWMRWRMLEQGSTHWGARLPPSAVAVTMFVFFSILGLWSALVVCGLAGLAGQRWRRRRSTAAVAR